MMSGAAMDTGSDKDADSPTAAVTDAMAQEEAALAKEREAEAASENKAAFADFEKEVKEKRMMRLNHLLDRSSAYADFLHARMRAEKEREAKRREKEARKRAKQEAKKAAAAAAAPSNVTDHSLRRKASGPTTSTSPSKSTRSRTKPAAAAAAGNKRIATDSSYSITDYVDEETIEAKRSRLSTPPPTTTTTKSKSPKSAASSSSWTLPDGREAPARQPRLLTGGRLREYQLDGVDWLKALYENGLNGILADEMGLGKTVQVIAFFAHLYSMQVRGPYLVVGPLSTLSNWYLEFQRFTPDIPLVFYHGTPDERAEKRRSMRANKAQDWPVVLTSFEIAMRDRKHLQHLAWKYIVVDEGHRLKDLNCRLIRELKSYQSANRLLLTGTPLQNNLAELWSLLNFLLPDIFDDLDSFQRWFDMANVHEDAEQMRIVEREQEEQMISKLHHILQPFLLRRLKTDVELTIPPKKEIVLYAPLTKEQKSMYELILNRSILQALDKKYNKGETGEEEGGEDEDEDELLAGGGQRLRRRRSKTDYHELSDDEEYVEQMFLRAEAEEAEREEQERRQSGGKSKGRSKDGQAVSSSSSSLSSSTSRQEQSLRNVSLLNIVMHLRKCSNHPYLIDYPLTSEGDYHITEDIVQSSGKMLLLDRLLPALLADGHKVLIFSQMTKMLDILGDYLYLRDIPCCRLDGSMAQIDRAEHIKSFNEDGDMRVFLLSTRAGGLGLNLMAADTVILYDSDWNPQCDLQAQDRAHRIGQTRPVNVYRFLTANTVDQHVYERAEGKRKLERLVIHRGRFKGRAKEKRINLTREELLELLTENASEKLNLAGNKKEVLTDSELKSILDRSVGSKSPSSKAKEGKFRVVEEIEGGSTLIDKLS